jgi:hypothetical protein
MSTAIRIAIVLCLLSAACTPEGEPMPIGGRTVEIHEGPIDVGETDPRRAPIADSMRRALEDDLEQPLRVEISSLRERDGWAFATVYARTPAGAQIDWTRTHYADERRSGVLEDDTTYLLLQRRGDAWNVRELSIGSPDNAWMDWGREYGAPKEIFWLAGG